MARIKIEDLSTGIKMKDDVMEKVLGGLSKYGSSSDSPYPIVREILNYLQNRPDGSETLSGISKWWLEKK
jgi:hypothetical protein